MNKLNPFLKTVVASVVTIAYAIQAALSDDVVSADEAGGIIALLLTAVGVFTVRNKPAADTTPGGAF